jgi:hypothetical protein
MMRAASPESHARWGLPPPLAALDHRQGLLVWTARRFNAGPALIGIGHRGGSQLGAGGAQRGILRATALLFGRANDPLPRSGDKTDEAAGPWPAPGPHWRWAAGTEVLAEGPHTRAIADFPHQLIAPTGPKVAKAEILAK